MTTAERSVLFSVSAIVAGGWALMLLRLNSSSAAPRSRVQRVQASALPSASTGIDIPVQGSVKDSIGRTYAASGTLHVEITEPAPVPVPVPVPGVITFGAVTDIFGTPLTAASAGKLLLLKGSGFPNPESGPPFSVAYTRLTLAGQTMKVEAWTPTSLQFGISNTLTDTLPAPLTGVFAIYQQVAGTWALRGSGGKFTIVPSPRVGTKRR
jgi:hypothetical protein